MKNAQGTVIPLTIPDTDWPELQRAKVTAQRLSDDLTAHRHAYRNLMSDRERAVEADRNNLARSLREGRPKPKEATAPKLDAKIADEERMIDALVQAVADHEEATIDLVEEHRARWLAELDASEGAAIDGYREAIDALEASALRVVEKRTLYGWIERFPEHSRFYVALSRKVDSLVRASGERFSIQDVIDGLRDGAYVSRADRVPGAPSLASFTPRPDRDGHFPGGQGPVSVAR